MALNEYVKNVASTIDQKIYFGTAAPTDGTFVAGDRVINTSMASGSAYEWVCITGGTPGTWKGIYPPQDAGTATASSGAATLSKMTGVVTTESLTTAAAGSYTLTLTNTLVAATSVIMVSVQNGSNTQGQLMVGKVTPGSGSATIIIWNKHSSEALNGTIKIAFAIQ